MAAELVRDGLVPVHRDNLLNRYNLFAESIQKGCQVEAALDQVRPFHDRGRPLLVDKQECIEFARSMAHHDRAISEGDVASFLTNARKRKAEKAGKDASMCRQVCPKTVHGYLQVFEDMPGEIKVHGSVQEKPSYDSSNVWLAATSPYFPSHSYGRRDSPLTPMDEETSPFIVQA